MKSHRFPALLLILTLTATIFLNGCTRTPAGVGIPATADIHKLESVTAATLSTAEEPPAGDTEPDAPPPPEPEPEPLFDPDVDYMAVMIYAAAVCDSEALEAAVTARNAKIDALYPDVPKLTTDEFLASYETYAGFALGTDYMAIMESSCLVGDVETGRDAAEKRNRKIDVLGADVVKIDFDDLYLLSKIITAEAGSSWLSMEWKMSVGEVLLNRVASPEFPDTIADCIYQPGQYYSKSNTYFANMLPYEACVEAAVRLLNGERLLNDPSVVFQATFRQGSGVHTALYDDYYGYTYLCYSSYPHLYETEE